MLCLGLEMGIGPIVAVQDHSPAASAGVQRDDLLVAVDGGPVGDPLTLADRVRRVAEKGGRIELALQRAGQRRTVEVAPRRAEWYETPFREKSPMSVPALGIAFEVTRRVEAVASGSPAEAAGVRPGDVVMQAKIVPPSQERLKALGYGDLLERLDMEATAIDFEKHKVTWPFFAAYLLQFALPESRVELTLADGRTLELTPVAANDWFQPDRGLRFKDKGTVVKAETWAEAFRLGGRETADALLMVVRFLEKMGSRQVSFRAMGGPVTIAQMAYHSAAKGLADLLIFLTIIGANLAVLNFLPIPVLDGGHMVFLAYEGITGRPPNERVQTILTYLGLLLILGLVVVVFGLDFGLIPRH
jgi:regulator of sigma E protease